MYSIFKQKRTYIHKHERAGKLELFPEHLLYVQLSDRKSLSTLSYRSLQNSVCQIVLFSFHR